MTSWTFGPKRAEIGLGTAIFGISASNYKGFRSSRPNPCPGDPFRDRLKMVVVVEGDGRWWKVVVEGCGRLWKVVGGGGRWWKVVEGGGRWWKVVEGGGGGGGGHQELQKLGRTLGRRTMVRACHPCFCNLPVFCFKELPFCFVVLPRRAPRCEKYVFWCAWEKGRPVTS